MVKLVGFFRSASRPSRGKEEGVSLAKRARTLPFEALPGRRRTPPRIDVQDAAEKSTADNAVAQESLDALRRRQEEEKAFIKEFDTATASVWYLVDCTWLTAWKSFVARGGPLPGPIDNSRLVDSAGSPRPSLRAAEDYRGVNARVWNYWQDQYGGGPTVCRAHLDIYSPALDASGAPVQRRSPQRREQLDMDEADDDAAPVRDAIRSLFRKPHSNPANLIATTSAPASPRHSPGVSPQLKFCCDKCDGPHATDSCPHFRGPREQHADAWRGYGKARKAREDADRAPIIKSAHVVRQPGDGSCLFHSLSYGLADRSSASSLRREICDYIAKNPDMTIADTPLQDWIRYDSGGCVQSYADRMAGGTWGGGIEMAALTKMRHVNVHVYEKCKQGFERISAFESPGANKTVSVVYQGRMHYDALEVAS